MRIKIYLFPILILALLSCTGAKDRPAAVDSSANSNTSNAKAYQSGDYILGMDISAWSEQLDSGVQFVDTDGEQKDFLALLKNHGINYIRLRTFVDPTTKYGYARAADHGRCKKKTYPYNSKQDIVRVAKKVRDAGMGLLLDFHYSDTWADPQKQIIPQAWRNAQNIDELADYVSHYTTDVLKALEQENALPQMVQVGNEITPGMLIHVPGENSDCWGENSDVHTLNGLATEDNWPNLATLLKAGLNAVKAVDDDITTMLHIENTEDVSAIEDWVNHAQANDVKFDILGLSGYVYYQGPKTLWRPTLKRLAANYPDLKFSVVEYNPEARLWNDIMRELPNGRGVGTFLWEPTFTGPWGDALFTREGNVMKAKPSDFDVFDKMADDYGLRKTPQ